ncbi:phage portal protein [Chryseobacterium joostei]|uniref:Phage portal protein n=1 Tax=Chryseobacterium joostei TaxID=112234 RepID=A0A1N7IB29_9FLAO|nr:phage portal protein [Chryseobacterium joostei]AZB01284.1 phage portal protein [Chryseobacterium joostei]SIS34284.1 Phage portal protein [Chryseobacterium joostei]
MGLLRTVDNAIKSWGKSIFSSYERLNDGTHAYHFEREDFLSYLGIGNPYYTPCENLKSYYFECFFLADCIDIYVDTCNRVRIMEVDSKGNEVVGSEYVSFLNEPNGLQNISEFISEMVINTLTTGMSIQYGNFFKNGNLKSGAQLFNVDFNRLSLPRVKNPYLLTNKAIGELVVKEKLEGVEERLLSLYELAYFYDRVPKHGFAEKGFNSKNFFNPTSRIFPLISNLHTLIAAQETMAYLSTSPVNSVLTKEKSDHAPTADDQKADAETKLSGRGKYGAGRGKIGDIIVTNLPYKKLDLTRDNKKLQNVEMQINSKDNIRTRFSIPKDYFGDSTYENKQTSEARFTLGPAKTITDNFLNTLTNKSPEYFKRKGTRLIGSYDHVEAVIETTKKEKNDGLKSRVEAISGCLDAFEKYKLVFPGISYDQFLIKNQLTDFFKQN